MMPEVAALLRLELDFDEFSALVSSRLKFPMPDGCHRTLGEQRVSPFHINRFHASVWGNERLDFYNTMDVHGTGQRRINSRSFGQDFPGSTAVLTMGLDWEQNRQDSHEKHKSHRALPHQGLRHERSLRNAGTFQQMTKVMDVVFSYLPCSSRNFSTSIAAMHPVPAAVIAWR